MLTPPPLIHPEVNRLRVLSGWVLTAGLLSAACLTLYWFEPTRSPFYPRCLFHEWTGLACPGCGSLRAVHQLSHAHLWAAFQFNPLLISLLPFVLWQMGERFYRNLRGIAPRELFPAPAWGWLALGLVIGFTIIRNLPLYPFPKV